MSRLCAILWNVAVLVLVAARIHAADPVLAFGLTNTPLGHALLQAETALVVSGLGSTGDDGVSLALGEADSGVFIYLDTVAYPEDGAYMIGQAFGRVDGVADQLICTVAGRRSTWGQYPIAVDFSPIGATQLVFEVYSGRRLNAKFTNEVSESIVRADYNGYDLHRVNPYWRLNGGPPGALFEFRGDTGFELPGSESIIFGNRLFIHALNATNVVQYVLRLDITSGGHPMSTGDTNDPIAGEGLPTFQFNELRLGKFGHPNLVTGASADAGANRLTVTTASPTGIEPNVAVELADASRFTLLTLPVIPVSNAAPFVMTAIGRISQWAGYYPAAAQLGSLSISETNGTIQIAADFPAQETNIARIQVAIYSNDTLVGMSDRFDAVVMVKLSSGPAMIAAGAIANSMASPAGLFVRFDQVTTLLVGDLEQASFEGNEVRFLLVEPFLFGSDIIGTFSALTTFSFALGSLDAVSITNEVSEPPIQPRLEFERFRDDQLTLSWEDPNREFVVEAVDMLDGIEPFLQIEQSIARTGPISRARFDHDHTSQFFRLRHYAY